MMSLKNIVDASSKVVVQGVTGNEGRFHTEAMLQYGTKIVAGVTPGKGGEQVCGIPVYNTVAEAVSYHGVDTSIVFVPARFAKGAAIEAIKAGLRMIVIITEMIPQKDSIEFIAMADERGTVIIGPNTPGIIVPPKKMKVGIMPSQFFKPGIVGVVSRSGTLTYEIALHISNAGMGQSACLGIGGDAIVGLDFVKVLEMFRKDEKTRSVVLIGEVGGTAEETAARYISEVKYPKPVIAYIAGRSAPSEKRMGHAGAIVMGNMGTAQSKIDAFIAAGVAVADKPSDIVKLLGTVSI